MTLVNKNDVVVHCELCGSDSLKILYVPSEVTTALIIKNPNISGNYFILCKDCDHRVIINEELSKKLTKK